MDSVATSLAVFWGQEIAKAANSGPSISEDEFAAPIGLGRCGSEGAGYSLRQADRGFWELADAVGRDQSLSTPDRGYSAALRRCAAEHAGGIHVFHLGLAGFVWGEALHSGGNRQGDGNEEVVRDGRE